MLSVSSVSQSAMAAAQAGMDASASRIAGAAALGTEAFRRPPAPTTGAGSADAEAEASTEAAGRTMEGEALAGQRIESGASMETDVVGMLKEKNAFLANLAVFRSSERMAGGLISLNS